MAGEPRESECSLLCADFHRLGHGAMVIDPTIAVTYHFEHAQVSLVVEVQGPNRQAEALDLGEKQALSHVGWGLTQRTFTPCRR
jgi:hypothetical protein